MLNATFPLKYFVLPGISMIKQQVSHIFPRMSDPGQMGWNFNIHVHKWTINSGLSAIPVTRYGLPATKVANFLLVRPFLGHRPPLQQIRSCRAGSFLKVLKRVFITRNANRSNLAERRGIKPGKMGLVTC
ncbi:MAG: hypothetical protein R3281_09995 [Balneolaceae bacterium]|nr:hypothetical protein [Balneolaceae bacterium]